MKKFFAILLSMFMMLTLISCSKSSNDTTTSAPSASETASETETTEAETETKAPTEPEAESEAESEPDIEAEDIVPAGNYQLIYEGDGAFFYYDQKLKETEEGKLIVPLKVDTNNCKSGIEVHLSNCTVNGFELAVPTGMMVMSGSEMEFELGIPTVMFELYGLKELGDVKSGFSVYTFNEETYETDYPAIAEIDPVVFSTTAASCDTDVVLPGDPLFDQDGVKVYSVQSEDEFYSCLNLYVINETGKDIRLIPADLEMNGEKNDTDYSDYAFNVHTDGKAFASLPLPNYTMDEETYEVTKFDVTSYNLDFVIEGAESF